MRYVLIATVFLLVNSARAVDPSRTYLVKFAGRQDCCGKKDCAFLEVFEHVDDFLPGLFGVIHRYVLAFLGASRRVLRNVFA